MRSNNKIITIIIFSIICAGCALPANRNSGPKFTALENFPADKSLIYLVKDDSNGGVSFTIFANDEPLTTLKFSSYFPYIAQPGKIIFVARRVTGPIFSIPQAIVRATERYKLELNVEEGKVYYITMDGWIDLSLIQVPNEQAEAQIKTYTLLPKYPEDTSP